MRTALRLAAVLAALARGERRGFITMTVQRTGSTWLSDELDAHPCITSGKEIFLNEKTGDPPWVWSDAKKRLALEALFDGQASLNFSATRSFEKFLGRCAGARGDVACGFKWMMSQHVDRAWDAGWLPELCAARKLRVVFLERLNLLRVHASTVAKNLASTSAGGHRNPTGEAPREAYIELASGDALVAKLEGIAAQYAGLRRVRAEAAKRGVATLAVTYEALQADRGGGLDRVARFVAGGGACDVGAYAFAGNASRQTQIHAGKLSSYVSNWAAVVDTLRQADDLSDMGVAPAAALRILSAINALRMAASKLAVNEVMDDSARHQAVLEAELKDHRARIAKLQLADVPEDLLCCISCEIMKDPVSADDGNTYERVCIEQWFATGKRTSPRTNEPLESLKLRPNHAIRRLTATYLESRGKDF